MTFLFLLQLCALHTVLTKRANAAPASDQKAPRPPHLEDVDCRGRVATITWVTGSDPGYQPTFNFTIFHRQSKDYGGKTVQETRRHELDATIYRLGMLVRPFTNNSFWVTGQNDAGTSNPSQVWSCNVPPEPPSENPPDVEVSRLVPNILTVTWTVVPREDHNGPGFRYLVSWQRREAEQKWFDSGSSDDRISGESNQNLLQENGEDIDEEDGSSDHDSEEEEEEDSEVEDENEQDSEVEDENEQDSEEEEEDPAEENVTEVVGNQEEIRARKWSKWDLKEIQDWMKNETEIEVDPNYSYLIKVESWNDLGQAFIPAQPIIASIRVPENSTIGQAISIFHKTESLPLKPLNGSRVAEQKMKPITSSSENIISANNYNTEEILDTISTATPPLTSSSSSPRLMKEVALTDSTRNQASDLIKSEPAKATLLPSDAKDLSTTLPPQNDDPQKLKCNQKDGHYSEYHCQLTTIEVNSSLEIQCPEGLSGSATWFCLPDGLWETMPDLSNCSRKVFNAVTSKLQKTSSTAVKILTTAAQELSMIALSAGDIFDTGKELIELNKKLEEDLSKIKIQKKGRKLAKKFLDAAVKVTENTLRDSAVWKDLQENKRVSTSTNLQEGLYQAAVKYTDYLHSETQQISDGKVVVSVANQPTTYFNDPNKGVFVHPKSSHTRITLPSNFYKGYQDQNDHVKVIFMVYQNLNCINNSLPCSPDEAKSENNMQAAAQVNSAIIGAKIGVASTWYASDGENVVIHFEHIYNGTAYRLSGSRCVWWNVTANSWESQGCSVNATNDHFTVCHCDHLTNLAVIMDIGDRLQRGTVPYEVMQLITMIGSSVSIFSLLLCILCFALLKKTPQGKIKGHNFSRMNLCICLLLAKVVMLAGLDATDNKPACTIVAIILHYLFLAMLAWSATEAYHLYKNFFLIFNRDGSRKKTFLVVGYVGPLFIVIVTFILSNHNGHWTDKGYGTDQACWLSEKLIWAFAGVALPVLLVNASFFVLTMKKAWEKRRQLNKSIIPTLAGSISIFLFLCLTWLSGYFYFEEGSEPTAVLFTILNSFIGVPMFVFSFLLDNSRTGQVKKMTQRGSEQAHKAQLTRRNQPIGENISSHFDVKRRNLAATTDLSSVSVADGTAWSSSSGSSTPSSQETYCANASSINELCGDCSSTSSGCSLEVTVSSRTSRENRVVTAILHPGSSVIPAPDAISLPDSEQRVEDFSILEVILSPSMLAPSSQDSCDDENMAVNAAATPICAEFSVAEASDAAKGRYEDNWNCLEMQSNSQWGERRW